MPRAEKLSLDEYLSFIDSHKEIDLTFMKLNQIIGMHGFVKSQRDPKKVLMDAVKTIELMDSSRSTLKDENVSSEAFMTLAEVIRDLKEINWQECCVTSIQTLNSMNYNNDLALQTTGDASLAPKSKPKRSRKRRQLALIQTPAADASLALKSKPKRSRKRCQLLRLTDVADDGGAAHRCGCSGGEGGRTTDAGGFYAAVVGEGSQSSSTFPSIAPY